MADDFQIRRAQPTDADLILTLLYELAEYERLTGSFALTKDAILRDFFGPSPAAFCDLAYADGKPIGLAAWYWVYTTFGAGRGIYLEDLYVRETVRGRGFGKRLLAHLAKEAVRHGAHHVKWAVLNWNAPSIAFYEGLGAHPENEWSVYRLAGEPLKALAAT